MAIPGRILLLVAVALAYLAIVQCQSGGTSWPRFFLCLRRGGRALGTGVGICAQRAMFAQYRRMNRANCRNCDKYFHCVANRRAMHCGGRRRRSRQIAWRVATVVSNCRERSQGGGRDSRQDQVANRLGRNGGNCERAYLDKVRCYFRPRTGRCSRHG
ncbi:unnamed protein product [Ixodes pacificus]